jgi:lipoprotein-anchoring transpeptidase ErfK/SrfK
VGRKLYIALTLAVVLLLGAAVAAYAWDESRSDEIAEGIDIGGVDVGGLTAAEAEALVTEELIEPLDRQLVVTYDGIKYILSAERLAVRADVDGIIDDALAASQDGGLPSRLWRYATGGEVDESIEPEVLYDKGELAAFVEKVASEIDREPINASVEPSSASIEPVPGQEGRTVRRDELHQQLIAAVQSPGHRRVTAAVDTVEPEVTTEELAAEYPVYLTVNRSTFELKLWKDLELAKTYTVAIGAVGFDTPAGLYSIQNKAVDPAWSVPDKAWAGDLAGTTVPGGVPENPLKERWMGIYDGAGIHGTDDVASLGSAASHGCVRMAVPDVIELYDQVPVGTPIYIG